MSVSISLAPRHSAIPLGSLLGPWLIGLVVSSIVFGITCLQVYLILDIVHVTLLTISYYVTSVDNFGDFEAISTAPWSLPVGVLSGQCITVS
ncbi:hypothetical protein DFH08DRAFT_901700 [Mycena albidolilacea]|uniref:Uncharacterized protein n=1 Tax=Mycena albidolilacea TaxID=1033008 RepID=A0AAD6Z4G9_9AGAR|nr:hypothetical protein DFH08DRAFT_901700 [Mycena albidolilacea]